MNFPEGTFAIGGDLKVRRLGFGAMRITGSGVWGEPKDPDEAMRVVRRAVELGVTLIDTADSYGPEVSERLIAQALSPYRQGLVIATKGGYARPGPGRWVPDGRPEHLKFACEGSLRRLRLDRIDLYQMHVPDPRIPIEDSIGALAQLRDAGKIRYVGVSNFSVAQIKRALAIVPIVSVQNSYNLSDRSSDQVIDFCAAENIGFIPYFPLAIGSLARRGSHLKTVAARYDATPGQIALAWLLKRSPAMLPIPGTSSIDHLEENMKAAAIRLSDDDFAALGN
jgi:pyridoxine 4-dehydrogenase